MSGINPITSFMNYFGLHDSGDMEREKTDNANEHQVAVSALSDKEAEQVRSAAIDNLIKQGDDPKKAKEMIDALW
ncbi:MAG: hypothetical protein KDK56_10335 [Simkania sp.]|nr:hypothetical protein [Simkania sp.]